MLRPSIPATDGSCIRPLIGAFALLALSACGSQPAAAPAVVPSGSAAAAASTAWDDLAAVARKEGKVSIITQPGNPYRLAMDDFQKQFGISVDIFAGNTQDEILSKVGTERQAGQYNWDLIMRSATQIHSGLKPMNALDPIRPLLTQPGILDDSKWIGGFDAGWADTAKSLAYTFVAYQDHTVWVNRNVVSEGQFNSVDQLWDPQWRGKIASQDMRVPSNATTTMINWLVLKGDDKVRTLLRDQQLTLTQDRRQLAEWVIRGQYPIGIAVDGPTMTDLANQGVDVSQVKPLTGDDPATVKLSHGPGTVALFNRAPHPAAAKLLLNWILSREGETAYAQRTGYNVRRVDVPPVNPDAAVDPKRSYVETDTEQAYNSYYPRELQIAKEELK
ncbi:MAG TPA: extracellular solute-binding protein [Chloroflexota bacterium]|nr:extracellular solute-binding protein [Chloroflexota bacterium]